MTDCRKNCAEQCPPGECVFSDVPDELLELANIDPTELFPNDPNATGTELPEGFDEGEGED